MSNIDLRYIPRFIKASDEIEFQKKFLRLQLRTGLSYKVVTIYENKKGEVVGWVYMNSDLKEVLSAQEEKKEEKKA